MYSKFYEIKKDRRPSKPLTLDSRTVGEMSRTLSSIHQNVPKKLFQHRKFYEVKNFPIISLYLQNYKKTNHQNFFRLKISRIN